VVFYRLKLQKIAVGAALAVLLASGPVSAATFLVRIDEMQVTHDEFERQVNAIARQTFYHGKPLTDDEWLEFRQTVVEQIVDRKLKIREAQRRGIATDEQYVVGQLRTYEDRYVGTERWASEGEQMLARLRAHFVEESLLAGLAEDVQKTPSPPAAVVKEYYATNIDKFTEPARQRVSVILLRVDPSAVKATWEAAREESGELAGQIRDGKNFSELARLHSADVSSDKGGDMGYLHSGMLNPAAQGTIDGLGLGEVSNPVDVLEGVAIFMVTERTEAAVREFDAVRDRAADLWSRDAAERASAALIAKLRDEADIEVDEYYLRTLPTKTR
jgi:parvulin-like peptidyl-prolyl isomerase